MPPKVQATSLSVDQVQLLCQVFQYSEPIKGLPWDTIARELNIKSANAAQQRYGRLLKALKMTGSTGSSNAGTPMATTAGKRGAAGKANGKTLKKPKYAEQEEDEEEDESDHDEQSPSKKCKTETETGIPKWKSVFGGDSGAVKIKDEEAVEDTAGVGQDGDDMYGEVVD